MKIAIPHRFRFIVNGAIIVGLAGFFVVVGIPYMFFIVVRDAVQWMRTPTKERVRICKASTIAMKTFEESTGKRAISAVIIHEEPERSILRVCYGNTRPPRRAYFAVNRENQICEPLKDYRRDKAWR